MFVLPTYSYELVTATDYRKVKQYYTHRIKRRLGPKYEAFVDWCVTVMYCFVIGSCLLFGIGFWLFVFKALYSICFK